MRGDKFMKVVVFTLLCVVASYLIFSVTRFSGDGYTTYKAVRYEVGDGITTSGFLVRSEELISSNRGGIIVPVRAEGEKVGKGQNVAAVYRDESAKSRQLRIEAMAEEIEQMRYAYSFSSAELDTVTLDSDILRTLIDDDGSGSYDIERLMDWIKNSVQEYGAFPVSIPPIPLISPREITLRLGPSDIDAIQMHIETAGE